MKTVVKGFIICFAVLSTSTLRGTVQPNALSLFNGAPSVYEVQTATVKVEPGFMGGSKRKFTISLTIDRTDLAEQDRKIASLPANPSPSEMGWKDQEAYRKKSPQEKHALHRQSMRRLEAKAARGSQAVKAQPAALLYWKDDSGEEVDDPWQISLEGPRGGFYSVSFEELESSKATRAEFYLIPLNQWQSFDAKGRAASRPIAASLESKKAK